MKLKFEMERLGPQYLLNEPQSILFHQIREEQEKLIKELYEMMVADEDI
jgi:hypothetical protein